MPCIAGQELCEDQPINTSTLVIPSGTSQYTHSRWNFINFFLLPAWLVLISPWIILVNLLDTSISFGGQDTALLWSSSAHVSYALVCPVILMQNI